jgi:predicted component of type VI protein secretion system
MSNDKSKRILKVNDRVELEFQGKLMRGTVFSLGELTVAVRFDHDPAKNWILGRRGNNLKLLSL